MSELISFEHPNFWVLIKEKQLDKGGVYKIIAARDNKRVPINRFLGIDPDGILYIGMGKKHNRIINLKKSISPTYKGKGHSCGRKYKQNPNISIQFPYEILYIELVSTENHQQLERELLEEYQKKFGEVPPLNSI